ncbi:MAG: MurR/RpiR family transcriptional regulator [Clostridia bacterium]|nr:MurR/RpiR family transcriptional regulator [Clostridia bacterium]
MITKRMPEFSKGQKRIAQYILEHYDEAAFMTAFRLGETVGVSESTVVRFAAELGFDGYPELQKAVQELIRSKLNSIQRIEVTRARMADDEVLDNILTYDMANLRQTLDELPRDTFYQAVDAIIRARKVYIFGAGSCRSLANFTAYYLKMLLGDIELVYTSSEMEILEEMFHINEQDVLIGLSFPRYSSKAVKAVHFAHSRNAKVVAITDSMMSPIAAYADHLLLAHSDMATIVDSLVAPLSIINALIVAVAVKTLDANRAKLTELESLWDTYSMYAKDEAEGTL